MWILGTIGGLLYLVGLIWTIVTAFKSGGALWGVLNILLCVQPLIGIISAILKKAAWAPVGLMILGFLLSLIGNYPAINEALRNMPR